MGRLHQDRKPHWEVHRGLCLGLGSAFLLGSSAVLGVGILAGVQPASAQTTTETETETAPTTTRVDDIERFKCEMYNGQPTVMYYPQSEPEQAYPWATPGDMGGGWSADRRCAEISRRLEFYRPDGLNQLQTAVENGYDTVCVTTQDNPSCRIVFTVPPGQDPLATRDRVFDNIAMANSGENTQSVYTFRDGGGSDIIGRLGEALNIDLPSLGRSTSRSNSINLRPFLDRSDRGTGEYLRGTQTPGRQLNPDDFR